MTEDQLFEVAYSAHEVSENAAMVALAEHLKGASVEALACLCDPEWNWTTRSWMSDAIIDCANEVLNEKLEAMVAA